VPDPLPVIETPRLIVRRFAAEDWRDLFACLSDPAVVRFEPYGVFSEEACRREAVRRMTDDRFWAVSLKDNKTVIGNVTLTKQDFDTWELGYVFSAAWQGRGYATESAGAMIRYAIRQLHARRIVAMCNPDNEKSWRLLERLHMRREGHLKQNVYFKTDAENRPLWVDTYEYGVLASEWRPPDRECV